MIQSTQFSTKRSPLQIFPLAVEPSPIFPLSVEPAPNLTSLHGAPSLLTSLPMWILPLHLLFMSCWPPTASNSSLHQKHVIAAALSHLYTVCIIFFTCPAFRCHAIKTGSALIFFSHSSHQIIIVFLDPWSPFTLKVGWLVICY
jgi:hypothetical protein